MKDTFDFGGWVMGPAEKRQQMIDARSRVDYKHDIEEFVPNPQYGRTEFKGRLTEHSKATAEEILAFADGGNVCFGGSCTIKGRDFEGYYYID